MNRTKPSASVTFARIGAIVMAIGVVAYLIWRAQSQSQPELPADGPPGAAQPAAQPAQQPVGTGAPVVLLPSSKDPGPDTLLPSSKFAPLPSSKSLVIESDNLLFSSKSGRPLVNPDVTPVAPPVVPQSTQSGTGGKQN